ncbi:MAG: diamine N-acetyltransferase [Candidatus Azotimanducaceae bacterium]|jgi:diamine N-acetyltransferase
MDMGVRSTAPDLTHLGTYEMIELRDVTPDNHLDIRSLAVHPTQQQFVATVDKTLADAFVWKEALVKAGYVDGEAFGLVMIFPYEEEGASMINIVRIMVAAKHQGKGLGRALLNETLHWIDALAAQRVRISTFSDNVVALSLYKNIGFVEIGIEDGEVALYLNRP